MAFVQCWLPENFVFFHISVKKTKSDSFLFISFVQYHYNLIFSFLFWIASFTLNTIFPRLNIMIRARLFKTNDVVS